MKNGKKIFILVETFLGLMVFVLVMFMFLEKNEKKQEKISVIIQNSDDSQWAAFKYGAKMAAADKKTEVFVVSTAGSLSVQEEENLIEREIANGASGIIVEPANGEKTEKMLKEVEKKVPVVLVESLASSDGTETKMPVTGADNYAMGKALAEEVIRLCGQSGRFSCSYELDQTIEEKPGYAAVCIAPQPDKRLDWLEASVETRHGLVRSRWEKQRDMWRYEIETPVEAEVVIDGRKTFCRPGRYIFFSELA